MRLLILHKDSITGQQIVDYDFLGKKLYPPKKLKVTDAGKEFAALFRELDRFYYPSHREKENNNIRFKNKYSQKQPCTVKMYYTDSKETHIKFLRNYMPQNNKKAVIEKPELFNEKYDRVPEYEILQYEKNAVKLGFKFIISPESQSVNMKALVRQFVSELEKITGFHFLWMAATHTDTGHTHSHLLINGVDKITKKEIRFDRGIVQNVARTFASNICTSLVGNRSQQQIELSRQNLPYAKRWTTIDTSIINSNGYNLFSVPRIVDNCEYEAEKRPCNDTEILRLNTLVEMGLALVYNKQLPAVYYLEKGWQDKLRAVGRYNTYLDARNKLKYVERQNLIIYTGDIGKVEGVITNVYNMDDESVWNNAVVIENRGENKAWYVPTRIKVKPDDLGKFITVSAQKNQKGKLRPLLMIHNK